MSSSICVTHDVQLDHDIWHVICECLQRGTLKNLCLVSSGFLNIIRPILYREVTLKLNNDSSDAALNLLCSHESLAQCVLCLKLYCLGRDDVVALKRDRFLEAIGSMRYLRSIKMNGYLFENSEEERLFSQRLVDCNIPIREFGYVGERDDERTFSETGLKLKGLTSLTWRVTDGEDSSGEVPTLEHTLKLMVPSYSKHHVAFMEYHRRLKGYS